VYLRDHRRIDPPFPPDIKFLANARCGEGAIVAPLYAHGRTVGVQIGYLDPEGEKSIVEPKRRRFMLEKSAAAVFEMPYEGENWSVCVCEGLEDALSVYRYGAMRCRVIGLPGIGSLRHLKFKKGTKVTVVPDGDPEGSAARKSLDTGLDALLVAEHETLVTEIPPVGWDA
jgi:hypothetical protein